MRIYIADNSAGIAQEHLERIFDQFISFQSEYAAKKTETGLYLSQRIVEVHRGKIHAQCNGLGYGVSFVIELLRKKGE